jgi:hypothetical protein
MGHLEDALIRIEETGSEGSDFSLLRLRLGEDPVIIISYGEENVASIYVNKKRAELRNFLRGIIEQNREMRPVFGALKMEGYDIQMDGQDLEYDISA